jgi:hypothetical protein
MRIALVVATLAATIAPALADQAAADQWLAEQRAKIAVMRADTVKREADQKALCDRLGGVKIGQTAEGVRKSCWGKPARVNETLTAGHRHEQWVYGTGHYVYLTDGIVTAAQAAR